MYLIIPEIKDTLYVDSNGRVLQVPEDYIDKDDVNYSSVQDTDNINCPTDNPGILLPGITQDSSFGEKPQDFSGERLPYMGFVLTPDGLAVLERTYSYTNNLNWAPSIMQSQYGKNLKPMRLGDTIVRKTAQWIKNTAEQLTEKKPGLASYSSDKSIRWLLFPKGISGEGYTLGQAILHSLNYLKEKLEP